VSKAKLVDRAPKSLVRRSAANGNGNGRGHRRPSPTKAPPQRKVVRVLDLDPFEKCGRGTSVQRLIRVDEVIDQAREAHLVFFDRHGWYCEHGPTCPAVGHARKYAERGARSH
jgi:hypothetical protein